MSATTASDSLSAEATAEAAAAAARAEQRLTVFRRISVAEGISFLLLLCVGMPLKYGADMPAATMVFGSIHGILFLVYLALAWDQRVAQKWDVKRFAVVLVASVLPTGPFWLHKSLKSSS